MNLRYEGRKWCLKADISEDIRQTFLTVDNFLDRTDEKQKHLQSKEM